MRTIFLFLFFTFILLWFHIRAQEVTVEKFKLFMDDDTSIIIDKYVFVYSEGDSYWRAFDTKSFTMQNLTFCNISSGLYYNNTKTIFCMQFQNFGNDDNNFYLISLDLESLEILQNKTIFYDEQISLIGYDTNSVIEFGDYDSVIFVSFEDRRLCANYFEYDSLIGRSRYYNNFMYQILREADDQYKFSIRNYSCSAQNSSYFEFYSSDLKESLDGLEWELFVYQDLPIVFIPFFLDRSLIFLNNSFLNGTSYNIDGYSYKFIKLDDFTPLIVYWNDFEQNFLLEYKFENQVPTLNANITLPYFSSEFSSDISVFAGCLMYDVGDFTIYYDLTTQSIVNIFSKEDGYFLNNGSEIYPSILGYKPQYDGNFTFINDTITTNYLEYQPPDNISELYFLSNNVLYYFDGTSISFNVSVSLDEWSQNMYFVADVDGEDYILAVNSFGGVQIQSRIGGEFYSQILIPDSVSIAVTLSLKTKQYAIAYDNYTIQSYTIGMNNSEAYSSGDNPFLFAIEYNTSLMFIIPGIGQEILIFNPFSQTTVMSIPVSDSFVPYIWEQFRDFEYFYDKLYNFFPIFDQNGTINGFLLRDLLMSTHGTGYYLKEIAKEQLEALRVWSNQTLVFNTIYFSYLVKPIDWGPQGQISLLSNWLSYAAYSLLLILMVLMIYFLKKRFRLLMKDKPFWRKKKIINDDVQIDLSRIEYLPSMGRFEFVFFAILIFFCILVQVIQAATILEQNDVNFGFRKIFGSDYDYVVNYLDSSVLSTIVYFIIPFTIALSYWSLFSTKFYRRQRITVCLLLMSLIQQLLDSFYRASISEYPLAKFKGTFYESIGTFGQIDTIALLVLAFWSLRFGSFGMKDKQLKEKMKKIIEQVKENGTDFLVNDEVFEFCNSRGDLKLSFRNVAFVGSVIPSIVNIILAKIPMKVSNCSNYYEVVPNYICTYTAEHNDINFSEPFYEFDGFKVAALGLFIIILSAFLISRNILILHRFRAKMLGIRAKFVDNNFWQEIIEDIGINFLLNYCVFFLMLDSDFISDVKGITYYFSVPEFILYRSIDYVTFQIIPDSESLTSPLVYIILLASLYTFVYQARSSSLLSFYTEKDFLHLAKMDSLGIDYYIQNPYNDSLEFVRAMYNWFPREESKVLAQAILVYFEKVGGLEERSITNSEITKLKYT